jgi:hypothetical protein
LPLGDLKSRHDLAHFIFGKCHMIGSCTVEARDSVKNEAGRELSGEDARPASIPSYRGRYALGRSF